MLEHATAGSDFSNYKIAASPVQEHPTGPEWWTDYQAVSYILTSKRGDRQQFANMIQTCHAAGVKVIAGKLTVSSLSSLSCPSPIARNDSKISCVQDTIFNHMTGGNGTGVAGSTFTQYDYPPIYQYDNFHHCGLEPGDNIVNYDNAVEVQTCQLDGLAEYVFSFVSDHA